MIITQQQAAVAARAIHAADKAVKELAPLKEELKAYVIAKGSTVKKSIELPVAEFIGSATPNNPSTSWAEVFKTIKARHPEMAEELTEIAEMHTKPGEGYRFTLK